MPDDTTALRAFLSTLGQGDRDAFAATLAARGEAEHPEHEEELFLAWACHAGKAGAVAAFEEEYGREVAAAWRAVSPRGVAIDEAKQRFREKLFVSRDGEPAIARYRGRGSLRAWTRITATRLILDLARGTRRERSLGVELLEGHALPGDPEGDLEKRAYRATFKDSLDAAARELTTRERNLLRYVLLDGLTIDQIAAIYGVHRATVARRLADARESLAAHVRKALRHRLDASDADLDEMLGLLTSKVDLSLDRVLGRGS